jgi:flagellar protein FlgJ
MKNVDLTGTTAFDANSLNALKNAASKENSPETIKEVAKQFEAIFMNMMLKSMREATPQENQFDNDQSRTFTSMLDQQLSSNLASKGLGLADILAKQLSQGGMLGQNPASNILEQAVTDPNAKSNPENFLKTPDVSSQLLQQSKGFYPQHLLDTSSANKSNALNKRDIAPNTDNSLSQNGLINTIKNGELSKEKSNRPSASNDFKSKMSTHAEEASRATGIPTKLMLGQAALETGWGKREIKGKDGTPSFNLFGIKANANWKGKVVEAVTTEYVNGVKQKHVTKFRAYDSYAESFKDFANLMQNNPRYQKVMANLHNADSYAQAMQSAGYATDPNYATKLASIINKVSDA